MEGVNLNAGNTNTVSITYASDGIAIDSMTVTTATELAKAQPHRRVLALAAADQTNLIQYLRELDGSSVGPAVATAATPTLSLPGSNYSGPQTVTITTATSGATLRYTLDGTDPTTSNGTLINGSSGTITVTPSVTLKARAFAAGHADSQIIFAHYLAPANTPTFNPVSGSYYGSQHVTITTSSPGASIRYTTDGTDPTGTSGTLIASSSGFVTIASTTTLKARAFSSGLSDSALATATYTINAGTILPSDFIFAGNEGTTGDLQSAGRSRLWCRHVLGILIQCHGHLHLQQLYLR